eukprot:364406-Chlamydomonas_euryale.AAC.14
MVPTAAPTARAVLVPTAAPTARGKESVLEALRMGATHETAGIACSAHNELCGRKVKQATVLRIARGFGMLGAVISWNVNCVKRGHQGCSGRAYGGSSMSGTYGYVARNVRDVPDVPVKNSVCLRQCCYGGKCIHTCPFPWQILKVGLGPLASLVALIAAAKF